SRFVVRERLDSLRGLLRVGGINRGGEYLQVGRNPARTAVLELDFGFDELIALALEQRIDQDVVLLRDEGPAHLARAGQFVIVGIELLVQDEEARYLRSGKLG